MNFDLYKHTILLTIEGSRAYGTNQSSSDVDLRAVAIPPLESYLGIGHNFEQMDKPEGLDIYSHLLNEEEATAVATTKLDGSIYDFRKFVGLATENNPNILNLLFCRDEEVRFLSPEGKMLRDNRDIFLSQRVYGRYWGYAAAQLKRLNSHRQWLLNPITAPPVRSDFDLPPELLIPQNQLEAATAAIKAKTDSWSPQLDGISEADQIVLMNKFYDTLSEIFCLTDSQYKAAARAIGYDENLIHLLERERKFKAAVENFKSYTRWKATRNPARAALEAKCSLNGKHASHCLRLVRQCYEILSTGKVNVWRGDIDAEELLDIRNGNITYDQLKIMFDEVKLKCDTLMNNKQSVLPSLPDHKAINELSIKLIRNFHRL